MKQYIASQLGTSELFQKVSGGTPIDAKREHRPEGRRLRARRIAADRRRSDRHHPGSELLDRHDRVQFRGHHARRQVDDAPRADPDLVETGNRRRMLTRLRRNERGSVLVILAVGVPTFILLAALVLDFGNWYAHKRSLQNRVDAAAFAAGVAYGFKFPACTTELDSRRRDQRRRRSSTRALLRPRTTTTPGDR